MLEEGVEPDKIDQNIKVTGLDLTESEDRALSAIADIAETPKLCPLADDAGPFYPDS